MEFLYIFSGIAAIAISIIVALEFGKIAEAKGHSKVKYFWFSFLFGLIGYLMVVALPDRGNQPDTIVVNAAPAAQPAKAAPAEKAVKQEAPEPKEKIDQAKVEIIDGRIVCPNCGVKQNGSRNVCYECGCKFIKE